MLCSEMIPSPERRKLGVARMPGQISRCLVVSLSLVILMTIPFILAGSAGVAAAQGPVDCNALPQLFARMTGDEETPPNTSPALSQARVYIDQANRTISVCWEVHGLVAP